MNSKIRISNLKFSILSILIIFIFSMLHITFTVHTIKNIYRSTQLESALTDANYLKTFDLYGTPNHLSYNVFIEDKNALYALHTLYNKLSNMENCNFLEINDTLLQVEGDYKNSLKFIHHYEAIPDKNTLMEFVNQKITVDGQDRLYTNVKSLLIGENTFKELGLNNSIMIGNAFNANDYLIHESPITLNVILGNKYNDVYTIGDEFRVLYLGEDINLKVSGFLKNNTSVQLGANTINLDYHIIMPSFNLDINAFDNDALREFSTLHYSKKTWGYISKSEGTDFKQVIDDFNTTVKNLNLDYICDPVNIPKETKSTVLYLLLTNKDIMLLIMIQALLFCFIMCSLFTIRNYKQLKIYEVDLNSTAINSFIQLMIHFLIGFTVAVLIYYVFNKHIISYSMLFDALKVVMITEILVLLFTYSINQFLIKKISKAQLLS